MWNHNRAISAFRYWMPSTDDLRVLGFFFLTLLLIFSSPIYFPYLLADDNWIMRGGNGPHDYPGLKFIALSQGRPIFAALIFLSRQLSEIIGLFEAVIVIRLMCIVFLSISGLLIYRLLRNFGFDGCESICISIAALTLPTFQVYIGNGPWLSLPFMIVVLGSYVMLMATEDRSVIRMWFVPLQLCLFIGALATYQSIVLVAFPLLLIAILFGPKSHNKFAAVTFINVLASIAIYYLIWRLLFSRSGSAESDLRYSPINISFDYAERFSRFVDFRLPQALNLWKISIDPASYAILIAILFVFLLVICKALIHKNWKELRGLTLKFFIVLVMLPLADAIALAPVQAVKSYTALSALSLTILFLIVWALKSLFDLLIPNSKSIFKVALTILAVYGALAGQYSLSREYAVPLWVERQLIQNHLKSALNRNGRVDIVVVHLQKKLLMSADINDFGFSNLENAFYVKWVIRNNLRNIGVSENVEIKTLAPGQKLPFSIWMAAQEKRLTVVVIDLNQSLYGIDITKELPNKEMLSAVFALGEYIITGERPLFDHGIKQVIERFGNKVFDIDIENNKSLLSTALCSNQTTIADRLLSLGANPNRVDADGGMPVGCASSVEQLKVLLKYGLQEHAKDAAGMPTLHVLVERNQLELVRMLVKMGYSVSPKGGDGRIPLHTAAHYGYQEMVAFLTENNSKINVKTLYGVTPLDWAALNKHAETVEFLKKHGALYSREIKGQSNDD